MEMTPFEWASLLEEIDSMLCMLSRNETAFDWIREKLSELGEECGDIRQGTSQVETGSKKLLLIEILYGQTEIRATNSELMHERVSSEPVLIVFALLVPGNMRSHIHQFRINGDKYTSLEPKEWKFP